MQSTSWVFTLNNYTSDETNYIESLYPSKISYLLYGRECGEEGTPHLQGYLNLPKKLRLGGLKKLIPRAHFEVAKGSPEQNYTYCTKEGDFVELGKPTVQGKRNDLEAAKEAIRSGATMKELREHHSDVVAKYPRFIRDYAADQKDEPDLPNHPLLSWQSDLYEGLKLAPDDRRIFFVVDRDGNKGKTWFIKYYLSLHANSQVLAMGKQADMAYALDPDIRVLFINCTRTQAEFMNYSFLEAVKDGLVFSSKYESRLVKLNKVHVVVMTNTEPDMNALSKDRYVVVNI